MSQRADEQLHTCRDRYFDWPSGSLGRGYGVRLRTVDTATTSTTVLTFKEPSRHESGSKPEHETTLADPEPIITLLTTLGLVERITVDKHCHNFRFIEQDRHILATLVHVPELNENYLEVETTVAHEHDSPASLTTVRTVLNSAGITEADLTNERYTDAITTRGQ